MTAHAEDGDFGPDPSRHRGSGMLAFALAAIVALAVWQLALNHHDDPPPIPGPPFDPIDIPVAVHVFEYGFSPSRLVIHAGQGVAWKDIGDEIHTITPASAAGRLVWREALRRETAVHVFRRPGVYPYYCAIHPRMRGVIVVRPAAPTARSARRSARPAPPSAAPTR